jgi:cytochrome c oxidase subunit IV
MAGAAGHLQPGGHDDVAEQHSHPKPIFYIWIFVFLFVITALEVIVTFEPLRSILPQVPTLLLMAVLKGVPIVLFYMHLKYDSRVFSAFFVVGLILAISMIVTFMALFTAHYRQPFDEAEFRQTTQGAANAGGTAGGARAGGH